MLSIVIPSLNQGAFIDCALRSIFDQRQAGVEVIVVDGGSRDETCRVLDRHRERIAQLLCEPDSGPASALNKGFRLASGNIFGVLNADDFLLPGSLATVVRAFEEQPGVDVISGHGCYALADGSVAIPAYSDPWERTFFRHGACVLLQPATFFRRRAFERVGGFRESGRLCWDMELWADFAAAGAVFATLDARLAAFRLHSASLTGRAGLLRRRREDARAVAAEMNGGAESAADRVLHYWYRARKFARHPVRAWRQRRFFKAAVGRWNL